MPVLTAIWGFVKKHWQVILLVAVVAVGYAWIRNQQAGFADTLKQVNDSHQVEIDKINQARQQEAAEHAAQVKQLQESVAKINEDYAKAQQALVAKQEQAEQDILKQYGNDTVGLANLLAERMGFVVVTTPKP